MEKNSVPFLWILNVQKLEIVSFFSKSIENSYKITQLRVYIVRCKYLHRNTLLSEIKYILCLFQWTRASFEIHMVKVHINFKL